MPTFEQAFNDIETASASTLKSAAELSKLVRQMNKAAQQGNVAAIKRTQSNLNDALRVLQQEVRNAISLWAFEEDEEAQYLKCNYASELLNAAREKGLKIQERDGRLISHPSIVQILHNERAVRIDRKKNSYIRPSYLANLLLDNQNKKSAHKSNAFLEALYNVYVELVREDSSDHLVKGGGHVVPLERIYKLLTSLPGITREYDRTDFARDVYLLDTNGPKITKKNATVSFPSSTGARRAKGIFQFVGPDGQPISYYGLKFTEA